MTEVLVVAFVALLVFGATRVPALGDALGRAVSAFRRTSQRPASRTPPSPAPRRDADESASSRR
jgi:sec-independent protein translocase protein TatA